MIMASIQLFQILKARLGEREAEALVSYVDTTLKENNRVIHETNLRTLATKEDIFLVKEDIIKLEVKVAESKSDVIRWIFALFVTMMLAFIGLYLKK
jgi:hypothetical protein